MKISQPALSRKIKISAVFLAALIVFAALPVVYDRLPYKIVATKDRSFPWRIWIESPPGSGYRTGEYVELRVFFQNRYVEHVRFLIKQVACRGGDHLRVEEGVFYCNGREIARAQFKDSAGRPLRIMTYDGTIPEKSYFVLASHPMSYDSRYYGLVDEKFIVHRMRPIL